MVKKRRNFGKKLGIVMAGFFACGLFSGSSETVHATDSDINADSVYDMSEEEIFEMMYEMGEITKEEYDALMAGEVYDEGLSDEDLQGLSNPEPSELFLDVSEVTDRVIHMAETAIKYNGYIPFVPNKLEYTKGYVAFNSFRPEFVDGTFSGMGYEGYIQWLYLNTFGYIPECLYNIATTGESHVYDVSADELRTGDIGVRKDEETGAYIYGVCIGEINGKHVFSFQSVRGVGRMFTGCNRIAYLSDETPDYICQTAPVDYDYYFRPNVIWDIENDSNKPDDVEDLIAPGVEVYE